SFQQVPLSGNSFVASFLMALVNNIKPEKLVEELNDSRIKGEASIFQKELKSYNASCEKALSVITKMAKSEDGKTDVRVRINDNEVHEKLKEIKNIEIFSNWLKNRLIMELLIASSVRPEKREDIFNNVFKSMRKFNEKVLGRDRTDNITNDFTNAIFNTSYELNTEHMLILGHSFNHPVTIFDIDKTSSDIIEGETKLTTANLFIIRNSNLLGNPKYDALIATNPI
ncbi:MAG: hypothetical protein JHC93_02145, partial [Parachlamydiales bacterium]|nr:hypothetical protein [Parachlamydiales bacterium]